MVRAVFSVQQALASSQADGLVGIDDLQLVETGGGPILFAGARGGGYLTGYDVGTSEGATSQAGYWQIGSQYLQLESTDLVARDGASGPELFLAGLAGNSMRGLRLDDDGNGPLIGGQLAISAPDLNLSQITEMELFGTSHQGIASLRGGGVVSVSFDANNILNIDQIDEGPGLQSARANGMVTTTHYNQSYAFVSYGSDNTVAMYRQLANGAMSYVNSVSAEHGLWVERPGALCATMAADGGLYVVLASPGSDSLSVLSVTEDGMRVVDHVLDSRDTRFDNASHVTSVSVDGQSYVLAAGADSGISLFVMLPGGRLQHVETFEATQIAPLDGITDLEAMAVPGGIRVWASTESAPHVSEFSISLMNLGVVRTAGDNGGTTLGTSASDVLTGGDGADSLTAGPGDDILIDGDGADDLRGGDGADTFIFTRDGLRDVIRDFDHTQDVIDLSSFGPIGGIGDLNISTQFYGVRIQLGQDIFEIHVAPGTTLNASHFDSDNMIVGGRVEVDPSRYPEPGTYIPEPELEPDDPPPPPPDGSSSSATQLLGRPPVFDGWQNNPTFSPNMETASKIGTEASEMIQTFGASDFVVGLFGRDTISTGNGNDTVTGDGGNDRIDSGNGSDLVLGGNGFDTIMAGSGHDTLVGGNGADSIVAGHGNDVVIGGDGYDQLRGDGGNDSIWGGRTADRIYGGGGDDFLSAGTNYGYTLDGVWGEAGNDTIYGNAGFDNLDGGMGDDTIDGGAQADNLFGRSGNDLLLGSGGLDRLFGGPGDDWLYGGDGPDGHFGEWGDDSLWGGEGTDRFFGGSGNDILDGGSGNDTLYAGSDFDTLVGGTGNDELTGNYNADVFVFADLHGDDTIMDFAATNQHERIDLSGMTQIADFDAVSELFVQDGADALVITGSSSSIRLIRVVVSDLDATDFIF